jgi:hypothetical protein
VALAGWRLLELFFSRHPAQAAILHVTPTTNYGKKLKAAMKGPYELWQLSIGPNAPPSKACRGG